MALPAGRGGPGDDATIRVVPFGDDEYEAEWIDGDDATRYRVYGSRAGELTLLNVRKLPAKPARKWIFVRYVLRSANELEFSIVRDETVSGQRRGGSAGGDSQERGTREDVR